MLKVICLSFVLQASKVKCGLLGYGTGEGSCAAPPFRSYEVQHSYGCPPFAPCCSEFGFCRPLEEWDYGKFRDCNGVSNGTPLLPETIAAEEAAGPYEGKPAGEIGPPPDVIREHYPAHKPPHHPPHADPHAIPHPAAHHAHHPAPHPLPHHAPQPPHPHPAPHTPLHHAHHPPAHHAGPHSLHQNIHHLSPNPAPHHASHHGHHPIHPHGPSHAPHHALQHVPHALDKPIESAKKIPTPYLPPHPEPKHHAYLAPEPHKPAYTAPEPHHTSYAAPEPHHPTYVAPEPHHPTYGPPEPQHSTYDAPEPHHPTYGPPEPHHPTYGPPEPHHPKYTAPKPHRPAFIAHPPANNAPPPHHPVYPAPVHTPHAPTHISHGSHHLQHHSHHHNIQPNHPPHIDPHHSPLHQFHHNTHNLQHAHQSSLGSHHQPHHLQIAHGTHQLSSHFNLSPHIGHSLQSPHHPLLTSSHVQPAPAHPFPVHSPATVTHSSGHVSPFEHALEPAHPLPAKSSPLSHSPFVSFGSPNSATQEPSLVNTVQLRTGENTEEIETPSLPTSVETRKPKAFESGNPFKTSPSSTLFTTPSKQEVQVSVTPSPILTTPRTISQSSTAESGAFVSFAQQSISEPKSTSLSEPPTTASPIQTFRPSTNMLSTPRPTAFSTIGSLNTISKSRPMGQEEFLSLGQNNKSPSSPTPKPENMISTILTTSSPFISSVQPFNLPTTRQPRVLQAVTPLVNIFASTPSPTILPIPTINIGSKANAQEGPRTALPALNTPILALNSNLGQSLTSFSQPSPVSQVRVPTFAQQNAVISIPVESKSQKTTQCQHPKGGGSYTCISFGVPHNPIFAFHTVQGDDGFFFGTGSGFPEHKIVNGPATIRRRRKLQKELIQKELARIKNEKKMRAMEDLQEEESSSIYIPPKVNNKLPITSYQKKLLERSESEKIFKKANKNNSRNAQANNADIKTLDKDAKIMPDTTEHQESYQIDFISEEVTEMRSNQTPIYKTVTTPKVQLYEYPVEETISYLTVPSAPASLVTTPSSFSEPETHSSRTVFLTEKPRRPYPSSYESLSQNIIDARIAKSSEP